MGQRFDLDWFSTPFSLHFKGPDEVEDQAVTNVFGHAAAGKFLFFIDRTQRDSVLSRRHGPAPIAADTLRQQSFWNSPSPAPLFDKRRVHSPVRGRSFEFIRFGLGRAHQAEVADGGFRLQQHGLVLVGIHARYAGELQFNLLNRPSRDDHNL